MERNLKLRSNKFAHECVKIALSLPQTYLGNHIRNQLVRCTTSVAANYRAALLGQTKKSFIAKLSIVIEEADECIFWLEFLIEEKLMTYELCSEVLNEAKELTAIFVSSRKTAEKTEKRI
ncbi:four helix bundle protein [Christiangramia echinicola]|uniref:four helix bundle protein n=1 Tax=Christiangramia echinicola TaxID=279359 RepID=UPI00047C8A53|nr:four helix bundle protein [Christiangramia echinicola]